MTEYLPADIEFAAFIEDLQTRVRVGDGARRRLRDEGRQIVPFAERTAREFAHQTEVLRNALHRHQDQPPRAA